MHQHSNRFGYDRGTMETVEFVMRFAGQRKTLLDVGCGDGTIARVLMDQGFDVTGIDANPEAAAGAKSYGVKAHHCDLLNFASPVSYDVVLFSKSLHHMHPLEESLKAAETLLSSDGVLIVDEFAAELVDLKTALWFYGVKSLIESEGAEPGDQHADQAYEQQHEHHVHHQCGNHRGHGPKLESGAIPSDPLAAWREHHFGRHGVIDSRTLLDSLRAQYSVQLEERLPYLYRYFAGSVAPRQGDKLFDWESRLCQEGAIERVGLRVIAQKRS